MRATKNQSERQQDSCQIRQIRAMELSALGTYIQHRRGGGGGDGAKLHEEMTDEEIHDVGEAMTRLALDTVKSVKMDAEKSRARGNGGCCLM